MPVCVSLLVDLTVSSAWAGQKNRGYITVQESCCQTMESRTKQKIRYETSENRTEQKIRYETAENRAEQKMRYQTAESRTEQKNPEGSQTLQIQAPGAVLMEASTGQIIYEKNADERRSPASITKIMTLILIFDAIDAGKIRLGDEVVTSAHAKSMGGSQVFLEEGEIQTVETLIKCIVIASGNDASVAMAEYISGSEAAFVQSMNERAKGLGMTGTHFVDCCGLTESPEHLTTARDIAVMSRELITKYPQIHNYSTIWMENITHVTKQGTKEFLSNLKCILCHYSCTTTCQKYICTIIHAYIVSYTMNKRLPFMHYSNNIIKHVILYSNTHCYSIFCCIFASSPELLRLRTIIPDISAPTAVDTKNGNTYT